LFAFNKIMVVFAALLVSAAVYFALKLPPVGSGRSESFVKAGGTAPQDTAGKPPENLRPVDKRAPSETARRSKKAPHATAVDIAALARTAAQGPKEASLEARTRAIDKLAEFAAEGSDEAYRVLVRLAYEKRYMQKFAVESLGKTKRREAVSVLEDFISHETPGVAAKAAWALGELGFPEGCRVLIGGLSKNRGRPDGYGEEIRREIILSLSRLHAIEAVDALSAELGAEEDISYKNVVARALGEMGAAKALPALNGYLGYLIEHEPKEEIALSPWKEAVKTARDAIRKIEEARK